MSGPSRGFRPSGSIEFEAVDVAALTKPAASAGGAGVDDGIERDALSINFGRRKDHKPAPAERMLAGEAIDWFVALGADRRPKALSQNFPHVANRLAAQWAQPSQARGSLQILADDKRWGQPGFPAQVQLELRRLLEALPAH